jgi:3-dehydroquinate synthase
MPHADPEPSPPPLRVDLGPRGYDIEITAGPVGRFAGFLRERLPAATQALVVTDANLRAVAEELAAGLSAAGVKPTVAVVPAGEGTKSLAAAAGLYDRLAELPADRKTPVVAVGGGVVGDLAGFAAATYNRGLPLVMVPTTLLAMVDSSVGGKVGVNHPRGKNLIGAFHQPAGVWIDTALLATLPDREYRSGLAEVVKYGVSLDAEFFEFVEAHADDLFAREPAAVGRVVRRSCELKAEVVRQDEREETGLRAVLNYGHTFAHAFEAVGGYGAWLHGEAVAAGMACAARLAAGRGLVPPELGGRQDRLLERFGLPTRVPAGWPADALLAAMRLDKKAAAGRLRFVLPTRLGAVRLVDDVPDGEVVRVLGAGCLPNPPAPLPGREGGDPGAGAG